MDTKQGYLVLQVLERYEAGEQPLNKVETKSRTTFIRSAWSLRCVISEDTARTKLRGYQAWLPGKLLAAGIRKFRKSAPTPEASKNKKGHKKYLLFGKKSASGQ